MNAIVGDGAPFAVTLEGLPPSVNALYRSKLNGQRYKREGAREWQTAAAIVLRAAWRPRPRIEGPARVSIVLRTKDRRRWDVDNRAKAVLDAIQDAGILRDDAQVHRLETRRDMGERDMTELIVEPIDEGREESI